MGAVGAKHYHVHVYFDSQQLETASQLHRELADEFKVAPGRIVPVPVGPHPTGMFQLVIASSQFGSIVEWLLHHRRGLDVLVHAVSGNDLKDHTERCFWLGQSHVLKLEALNQ